MLSSYSLWYDFTNFYPQTICLEASYIYIYLEMNVCKVLPCHFFCWSQSLRPCTCPDKKLHSTAAHPLVRASLCNNLDVCPTPPLSEKGTKLNVKVMMIFVHAMQSWIVIKFLDVTRESIPHRHMENFDGLLKLFRASFSQFANGQPGGEADVTCPGEDEPHTLICKANGKWSRTLRCQNGKMRTYIHCHATSNLFNKFFSKIIKHVKILWSKMAPFRLYPILMHLRYNRQTHFGKTVSSLSPVVKGSHSSQPFKIQQ